ncbi:MAG: hypothetical protein ACJA1A_003347 [Saprospiraceae bacterium]|jgi:hypothetical protein|tara:strand:- start:105 stop:569 length:465 start_codon:yes stop_codon:yes gene_type:complete
MEIFIRILALLYIFTLIALGIIQPIMAIARLITSKRKDSKYTIGLKRYLGVITVYFYIIYLSSKPGINIPQTLEVIYFLILPMMIAIWYTRHVILWKKKHKRILEFDKKEGLNNNNLLLLEVPCQERLELKHHPKQKIQIIKLGGKLNMNVNAV